MSFRVARPLHALRKNSIRQGRTQNTTKAPRVRQDFRQPLLRPPATTSTTKMALGFLCASIGFEALAIGTLNCD